MGKAIAIGRHLLHESVEDNLTGQAAKTAYYFFLSLFPLLLVVFSLTGILGGRAAFDTIVSRLEMITPQNASSFLHQFVRQITSSSRPDLLSLGALLLVWTSSNVFAALADGLNVMYDVRETRSWWKKRLIALGVTIAAAVLLVGGAALLLAGRVIGASLGFGSVWEVVRLPLGFLLVAALLWLAYYFLPNREQCHARFETAMGALVGTALWVLATIGFQLYLSHFGSYTETYGFVGAIIVLMLWLYLTALAMLFGGEVAATLEGRGVRGDGVRLPGSRTDP